MRRFTVLFCFAALMGLGASQASAQQAMEDVVYLKDGSILRGTIIEQIPGKSLKLQTADGNLFVYDMDKVERLTREPAAGGMRLAVHKKNPGIAFVLSLAVTGAGQFYNEEHLKGAIQLGSAVFGVMLVTSEDESVQGVGALVWVSAALWSLIDAPLSAVRINKQAQSAHLFQMDAGPFVVGADPVFRRSGAGGALTIRF